MSRLRLVVGAVLRRIAGRRNPTSRSRGWANETPMKEDADRKLYRRVPAARTGLAFFRTDGESADESTTLLSWRSVKPAISWRSLTARRKMIALKNKKSPVAAGPPGVRELVKQRMSARSLMDLGRLNLHDKDFHLIDFRQ
jgi:hypothetical protein